MNFDVSPNINKQHDIGYRIRDIPEHATFRGKVITTAHAWFSFLSLTLCNEAYFDHRELQK